MHDKIVKSGKYNFEGCRFPLQTHLNIDYFRFMLSDYHDKQLCDLLQFGFPIGYFGKAQKDSTSSHLVINHKGAKDFPLQMQKYLKKREITWSYFGAI